MPGLYLSDNPSQEDHRLIDKAMDSLSAIRKAVIETMTSDDIVDMLEVLREDDFQEIARLVVRRVYGGEAIVVHKPDEVPYFITSSSNVPARTKAILRDLITRMG